MADNTSNYLEDQFRDHTLRSATFSKPGSIYVALTTVAPTDADTGGTITEPSGVGYSRQPFGPGDAFWTGTNPTANAADITFPAATGPYTVVGTALVDNSSGGNVLYQGTLTAPVSVLTGQSFRFPTGLFTIEFR
jgi:hypothetical protein